MAEHPRPPVPWRPMNELSCPHCHLVMNASAALTPFASRPPADGGLVICAVCFEFSLIVDAFFGLSLRRPSALEHEKIVAVYGDLTQWARRRAQELHDDEQR